MRTMELGTAGCVLLIVGLTGVALAFHLFDAIVVSDLWKFVARG